jgi:hypothetical protein
MSHLSVQTKLEQFLQTCIITSKNKYSFWVSYRWINVLLSYIVFFLQFLNKVSHRDIFLFIFISSNNIIKFSVYLVLHFSLAFGDTFCFIDSEYCLIQMISPSPQLPRMSDSLQYLHKALCYEPEGWRFETWWGEFLNLPNPSSRTRPWGLLSL